MTWIDPVNRDAFFMKLIADVAGSIDPGFQVFTTQRRRAELGPVVRWSPFFAQIPSLDIGFVPLQIKARMMLAVPSAFRRAARRLDESVSVLYSSEIQYSSLERPGLLEIRRRARKLTRIVHNLSPISDRSVTSSIDLFDDFVFLSEHVRAIAQERLGIDSSRVFLMTLPHFHPVLAEAPADQEVRRRIRDIAAGRRVLAFISRPSESHGIDLFYDLIEAARRLQLNVCGVVLGRPDGGWDRTRDGRARAERGVGDLVVWSSFRPYDYGVLKAVLLEADAVVAPYREISQSAAITTALGEGIPVLASEVGSNPELVRDGIDGLIFDPTSPESATEMLIALYGNNGGARQRFAANAIGSHLDPTVAVRSLLARLHA